jgi:hypothetical protein
MSSASSKYSIPPEEVPSKLSNEEKRVWIRNWRKSQEESKSKHQGNIPIKYGDRQKIASGRKRDPNGKFEIIDPKIREEQKGKKQKEIELAKAQKNALKEEKEEKKQKEIELAKAQKKALKEGKKASDKRKREESNNLISIVSSIVETNKKQKTASSSTSASASSPNVSASSSTSASASSPSASASSSASASASSPNVSTSSSASSSASSSTSASASILSSLRNRINELRNDNKDVVLQAATQLIIDVIKELVMNETYPTNILGTIIGMRNYMFYLLDVTSNDIQSNTDFRVKLISTDEGLERIIAFCRNSALQQGILDQSLDVSELEAVGVLMTLRK